MDKNYFLTTALVLLSYAAGAQLSIAPTDKLKSVNCNNLATINVSNPTAATYIASVSGGLVIDDGGQEKSLVVTNGTAINVSAASGEGKLFLVNPTTGEAVDSASVSVNPLVLSAISGPECIGEAATETYSVTPIPGVFYVWVVERGGIRITAGQGTSSVTVQSTSKANSLLTVYVFNPCIPALCLAPRRSIAIRKTFPTPTDGLLGPNCLDATALAANDSIIAFFLEPVLGDFSGANNNDYFWNIPTSRLQPRFTSPDGSARAFRVLDASSDFSVSVTVGARCNPNNVLSKDINVPPPAPVMSQVDYCFPSTQTAATFSVDAAYDKPEYSYRWILPLNWSFADADSTSASVNVIMDANAGNVTVVASNAGCGQMQSTFTVNRVIAGASITTTNGACLAVGDRQEKTYSVNPPNNNQYTWTLPAGWAIKPGTSANASSVIVIPSGTNGGNVTATTQGCGGVSSTIPPIIVTLGPVAPAYISGPVCISSSTPSTALTYTVSNLGAGITYFWRFPTGWVLHSDGSPVGNGFVSTSTNSIAVRFPAARTTGTVSVFARGCIESDTTTWEVFDAPTTPVLESGTYCPAQGTPTVTYIVYPIFNATYTWAVTNTNGWSAVNAGESSRTATFNVGNGPAVVTVRAVAIQGCAGVQSDALSDNVNVIPAVPDVDRIDSGCIAVGRPDTITMTVKNQSIMPTGVSYAWTVPVGWTALSPNAATTQVITNGVAGNYTVSATASNTLCGGNTGSLGLNISEGLPASIVQNVLGNLYTYSVVVPPNTSGLTYRWRVFSRSSGDFLYIPRRVRNSKPAEILLTNIDGDDFFQIGADDSLVVEITDATQCTTTKYAVSETFPALSSAARLNTSELEENSSIEDTDNTFRVYPNPAKEKFTLEWTSQEKKITVLISDIHRRTLKELRLKGKDGKAEMDVSDMPPGLYVLLIKYSDGTYIKKLVIE